MKKFTDTEIAYLRGLKAVDNVTTNRIIYSEEFKRHFLREYWNGRKPTEIFRDAGLPVILLGRKRIERCTYRWVREGRNLEYSTGLENRSEEMIPNDKQGTMLALMETRNLLGDLATALNRLERIILMLGNDERGKREEAVIRDESESCEGADELSETGLSDAGLNEAELSEGADE